LEKVQYVQEHNKLLIDKTCNLDDRDLKKIIYLTQTIINKCSTYYLLTHYYKFISFIPYLPLSGFRPTGHQLNKYVRMYVCNKLIQHR